MNNNGSQRSCGIWMHVTALPGSHGCGTMGPDAFEFAETLAAAGLNLWQVLPLHPVRSVFNFSPYSPASCFAGNPLIIDEKELVSDYALSTDCFSSFPDTKELDRCVWNARMEAMKNLLWKTFDQIEADLHRLIPYQNFCTEAKSWLDDYALFETIADHFRTSDWRQWPFPFRKRNSVETTDFSEKYERKVNWYKFVQYTFFAQWQKLHRHCGSLGVRLLGDMPLYGQFDSADVWAHPEVFEMDPDTLQPVSVAGVPPDYFSQDGQLWGNPLYRWFEDGNLFAPTIEWWRRRMVWALKLTDQIRIDHFRGIESFWSIPAEAVSAREGTWKKGPDFSLFESMQDLLGDHPPLVAEDLGIITPEVEHLRDRLGLPGMKILQFAFSGGDNHPYLPHNLDSRPWVLYLGTHDNNTTSGWLEEELSAAERQKVDAYISWSHESTPVWKLIETAVASTAATVILSINDLLEYGSETRFNVPGIASGNWSWKLARQDIKPSLRRLSDLCARHNRR